MIAAGVVAALGHVWSDVAPSPITYSYGNHTCAGSTAVRRALDHVAAAAGGLAFVKGQGGIVFQATDCAVCQIKGNVVETGGCHGHRNVVHEVLHALGFEHEQFHPDAARWLTVDLDRIPAEWRGQWAPRNPAGLKFSPFDICSRMLYSVRDPKWNNAVALTARGEAAIARCTGATLSAGDTDALRRRYGHRPPARPARLYGALLLAAIAAPCCTSTGTATSSSQAPCPATP